MSFKSITYVIQINYICHSYQFKIASDIESTMHSENQILVSFQNKRKLIYSIWFIIKRELSNQIEFRLVHNQKENVSTIIFLTTLKENKIHFSECKSRSIVYSLRIYNSPCIEGKPSVLTMLNLHQLVIFPRVKRAFLASINLNLGFEPLIYLPSHQLLWFLTNIAISWY